MPHGHCYFWTRSLILINVISDSIIAIAYYTIPVALYVFVKKRKDISFSWIFVLFAIFILACGTTHLMEIWNIWHGTYRLTSVVKVITAIASILTAILIWPLLPKLLKLPSPTQLRELNNELEHKIENATSELQKLVVEKQTLIESESFARKEAEKANHVKDEFLSTLSHELRNPLNAIVSWLQILDAPSVSPQTQIEALSALNRNTKQLTLMIEDLIEMSNILKGTIKLDLSTCDMKPLVEEVLDSLAPTAATRRISFETKITQSPLKFKGDSLRIKQILRNLLMNAIKFSLDNNKVIISVAVEEGRILVAVEDLGKGISREFIPFVFDRFTQENQSITRAHQGLGLGLSTAKHLAELQGGSLTAYSEGTGHGSRFTLSVPFGI